MAFSVGNPVNTALVLYIIYRVNSILFPSINPPATVPHDFRDGYSWMPKSHPPTMLYKVSTSPSLHFIALTVLHQTYTPRSLAPFNGANDQRILLAIKGIVFDVSRGRNFYGPGTRLFPPVGGRGLCQFKRECTPTFPAGTPRVEWPNSRLTKVSSFPPG